MKRLTQTNLDPGNCLQTCIACILDLDVDVVPIQGANMLSYYTRLGKWLALRSLVLKWVPGRDDPRAYSPAYPEHVMCGKMVGPLGGACENHCVVGINGGQIWDPYPTRPGLARVIWLGLLLKTQGPLLPSVGE